MTNFAISRRGLLLAAGAATLATPFLGRGAHAATTLRYGHMHTPNSIAGEQAQWFADAVRNVRDTLPAGHSRTAR